MKAAGIRGWNGRETYHKYNYQVNHRFQVLVHQFFACANRSNATHDAQC